MRSAAADSPTHTANIGSTNLRGSGVSAVHRVVRVLFVEFYLLGYQPWLSDDSGHFKNKKEVLSW